MLSGEHPNQKCLFDFNGVFSVFRILMSYVPPEARNPVSEHGSLQYPKTQDRALWYNLEEISILSILHYGAILSAVPSVRQFIIQNIVFGNRIVPCWIRNPICNTSSILKLTHFSLSPSKFKYSCFQTDKVNCRDETLFPTALGGNT